MLQNYTILCDSNIPWDRNRYSKHHIMSRLARGNRVFFVNPRVDIADYVTGKKRKFGELFHRKYRPEGEDLIAYTPLAPPFRSRLDLACAIDPLFLSAQLKRLLRGADKSRLILFMGNPWNGFLLDSLGPHACSMYHCSDNFPAFFSGGFADRLRVREEELIRRSDVVVATSEPLLEKCLKLNENSHFIAHGVDEAFFRKSGETLRRPEELRDTGFPVIGFIGSIDSQLDFELLNQTVGGLKDYQFVFIGIIDNDISDKFGKLLLHENCRYLGKKPWQELPDYLSCFDVGIIPWIPDEFALNRSPLKLIEYLAAGKPPVTTNIRVDTRLLPGVTVASDADSFIRGIRDAVIACRDIALGARLSRLVDNWGWDAKVEEYSACLERSLRIKAGASKGAGIA